MAKVSCPLFVGSRLSACWLVELTVEGDEGKHFGGVWCSGSSTRPELRTRRKNKVSDDGAKLTYVCDRQKRLKYHLVDTHYRNAHATRQVVVSYVDRGMTHPPTNQFLFSPGSHRHLISLVGISVDSHPSAIWEANHNGSIDHSVHYHLPNTLPNPWSASRLCRSQAVGHICSNINGAEIMVTRMRLTDGWYSAGDYFQG